jgi:hypothetical protein
VVEQAGLADAAGAFDADDGQAAVGPALPTEHRRERVGVVEASHEIAVYHSDTPPGKGAEAAERSPERISRGGRRGGRRARRHVPARILSWNSLSLTSQALTLPCTPPVGQRVHGKVHPHRCVSHLLDVLRETREGASLTQVQLAERLGRSQSFVSKVEVGEARLDVIQLRTICQALGTTLPAFVARLEVRLAKGGRKK